VSNTERRSQRRDPRKEGLDPIDTTLSQRAREKKMFKRLVVVATKTDRRNSITKGRKVLGGIRNAMTNLPAEISNFPVQRKEKKLTPGDRPVKVSKQRQKFSHRIRLAWI